MKKNKLTIEKMIEIEKLIEKMQSEFSCQSITDKEFLNELNLKLEYVSPDEFPNDTEAELCPSEDESYLGLIRVNNKFANTRFAYVHELIHYLMDVGIGNKVTQSYARKTKGQTTDPHEQEINYATAAAILNRQYIEEILVAYDTSKPKMDELKMVNDICKQYEQNRTTVIRRIQEVRKLMKVASL